MTDPNNQDTPVARQWRGVEDGEERTGWKDTGLGDLDGWARYADKHPGKVVIEYRTLYSSDQIDRMRERAERAEAENILLEKQALRDRKLCDEAQQDALLWQYSIADGCHAPLLVMVWRRAKASEKALSSLCTWMLHRFGPDTPEGREASARLTLLTKLQDTSHE